MKNIDKLSLEYSKVVNNHIDEKLIYDCGHNINKEEFISRYQNYTPFEDVGCDIDCLDNYIDWLGEDIERY